MEKERPEAEEPEVGFGTEGEGIPEADDETERTEEETEGPIAT